MNAAASLARQTQLSDQPSRWRPIRHWIVRGALALVAVICALAVVGASYQAVATEADRQALPAPGQLVDVGGYRLHLHCLGSGSPTVILESALPAGSLVWGWVQPGVADTTRVCAYDRAGEGWSELGPQPRDAKQVASELHALLANAGVEGPFILVGHSFGGLYTRAYAGRYREQVSGMVLIDASHPDQWARTPDGAAVQRNNELSASVAPVLARVGVLRVTNFITVDPDLPPKEQAEMRAFMNGTRVWDSDRAVFQTIDQTMAEVRASQPLGSMPLVVLTATDHGFPPDTEQLHQQLQTELAALSSNSCHQVVQGATHVSLVDNRQQSQITVDAIRQVVIAARTGEALP
jgi:pimeloyl-ACP methyl ester carboxylesterase